MRLANALLSTDTLSTASIRAWLPTARHVDLAAGDLARIDSWGSTDGAELHAHLATVLPLVRAVWLEAEVVAQHGTRMHMGYGATPAGPGEIGVWFACGAATGVGDGLHIIGPLGPLRVDATGIDPTVDVNAPGVRELRAAAGIVIRALMLGLGDA